MAFVLCYTGQFLLKINIFLLYTVAAFSAGQAAIKAKNN